MRAGRAVNRRRRTPVLLLVLALLTTVGGQVGVSAPPTAVAANIATGRYALGTVKVIVGAGAGTAPRCATTCTVRAWGSNSNGQLGDGTTTDRAVPVRVSGLTRVTAIAGGANANGYALRSDGTVWAWGTNQFWQLSDGTTRDRAVPVRVSRLAGVTAIAGGANANGYALRSDGTVWAWGSNRFGELGDGTTTARTVPVRVHGLTGVTTIAGGAYGGYALRSDGTVWAWGLNRAGELGDGTTTARTVPVRVRGLTGVIAIAGGQYDGYALRSDGTVRAWGSNEFGQLGNGTTTDSALPVRVSRLARITAIASGAYGDGYALRSDGTVWAWGSNASGQLGNRTYTPREPVPVRVSGLTGVTAIGGGANSTAYALLRNGTVWAWGWNSFGQLGNGSHTRSAVPVRVSRLTGVTAIAGGGTSGYALVGH